jgi:hypothetical protein
MGEVGGEPTQEGGSAPAPHANGDDFASHPAVGKHAEGQGGQRVNEHERRDQPSKSGICELQITADKRTEGDNNLPIDVVDEIDQGED